jgi:DNA-binding MarR family transcriptional regulator
MKTGSPLFQLFTEIGIITQLAGTVFERSMPKGMTLAQFTVLNHFARLGGERSPAQLADAFQVTRGTMTSTLQKLVAKKFVEIVPDPNDGRGKTVRITKAGEKMRDTCIAGVMPELQSISAQASQFDVHSVLPKLQELRSVLDRQRNSKAKQKKA